jgi:hypothetical protein
MAKNNRVFASGKIREKIARANVLSIQMHRMLTMLLLTSRTLALT